MNKIEIQTFIEEMESIGDVWSEEEVQRCYGNISLSEAINIRKLEVNQLLSTLGNVVNYLSSKEE